MARKPPGRRHKKSPEMAGKGFGGRGSGLGMGGGSGGGGQLVVEEMTVRKNGKRGGLEKMGEDGGGGAKWERGGEK